MIRFPRGSLKFFGLCSIIFSGSARLAQEHMQRFGKRTTMRGKPLRGLILKLPTTRKCLLATALFATISLLTESRWLLLFPFIVPAPSWVPSQLAPLIGVPWKPRQRWYSQFGQDRWAASDQCLEKKLRDSISCTTLTKHEVFKTGGYFVELGSHDGITNSNTKALEDRFSWNGVCIEPDPLNFRLLSYNRPHCTKRNVLVGSSTGSRVSFVSGGLLSGIFGGMGGATGIHGVRTTGQPKRGTFLTMTAVTLTDVLDDVDAPHFIDYLSLDVEGNEHAVLTGLDHSKYKFGRITVEHNFQEGARKQVHQILSQHGYIRVETGSPQNCSISDMLGSEGMCMADVTMFCPCVDDFYEQR